MSPITVPQLVQAFIDDDLSPEELNVVSDRARRKIKNLDELLAWLKANPVKHPKTKESVGWWMHCVSGYSMPPYSNDEIPQWVRRNLDRIFFWLCVTPICGLHGPFKKSVIRAEFGRSV